LGLQFIELQQYGENAKRETFAKWPDVQAEITIEKGTLSTATAEDVKRRFASLKDAPIEERWRAELLDAYTWVVKMLPLPGADRIDHREQVGGGYISRQGFLRLLVDGRLLDMTKTQANESFRAVDTRAIGFVGFEDLWPWFEHAAQSKHRRMMKSSKKKEFLFKSTDLISVQDRCIVSTMRRLEEKASRSLASVMVGTMKGKAYSNLATSQLFKVRVVPSSIVHSPA
jgi:hypothetical protein